MSQNKYKKFKTKEEKEKELKEAILTAENDIEKYYESPEDMKEYLDFAAKIYNYSYYNSALIQNQFPSAQAVGSFMFWKSAGFSVKADEHGMKILVPEEEVYEIFVDSNGKSKPVKYATAEEREKINSGEIETTRKSKLAYKIGYVFDISQTTAKPEDLPKIFPGRWLDKNIENADTFLEALKIFLDNEGITYGYASGELGNIKGLAYAQSGHIELNRRNSDLQNIKTIIHEYAHCKLHKDSELSRWEKEFQAEMAAYTICKYFGIDTSDYSLKYINDWSKGKTLKEKKYLLRDVTELMDSFVYKFERIYDEVRSTTISSETIAQEALEIPSLLAVKELQEGDTVVLKDMNTVVNIVSHKLPLWNETYLTQLAGVSENRIVYFTARDIESIGRDGFVIAKSYQNDEEKLFAMKTAEEYFNFSSDDMYAIYQLKQGKEYRDYSFTSLNELKSLGKSVDKDNYNFLYTGSLDNKTTLDSLYDKFNTQKPTDFTGHSLSVSDVVVIKRNGKFYCQYIDDIGFKQVPEFYQKPLVEELEKAYRIENRYLSIQESNSFDGFDYSIYDENYNLIDGGIIVDVDSISVAVNDLVKELKEQHVREDGTVYKLPEQGNISTFSVLEKIDYDELQEAVEIAEKLPRNDYNVINNFKAETSKQMNMDIFNSYLNPNMIESEIREYIENELKEADIKAEIVDLSIYGSRCRGLEHETSDLDVVVQLKTDEREDSLFNFFHTDEEPFVIDGITVDINPIKADKSGCLSEYLLNAEKYLNIKKTEIQAKEEKKEMAEKQYYYTVAECSEFHSMGEYHDNITDINEAVRLWNEIPSSRMNGIKSIGIGVHTVGTDEYEDVQLDILTKGRIDIDMLEFFPELLTTETSEMIGALISAFPDIPVPENIPDEIKKYITTSSETETKTETKNTTKSEKKQTESSTKTDSGKIQDFGEKIGDAKKDRWKERGLLTSDLSAMTFAETEKYVKKDNVWKKPDYVQMIKDGTPIRVAWFTKLVRDSLPTTPLVGYRNPTEEDVKNAQKNYIQGINDIKTVIAEVKDDKDIVSFFKDFANKYEHINLMETSHFGVSYTRTESGRAFVTDKLVKAMYQTQRKVASFDYDIKRKQFGKGTAEKIPAGYSIKQNKPNDYYKKEGVIDNTYYIAKGYTILEDNIPTYDEALTKVKEIAKKTRSKGRKSSYKPVQLENVERIANSENSTEVTGDMYLKTFNFRGGEFGNWMSEKDRQYSLDYGYDALCDLATALGIEKSDIGLDGKLAIAFGSRGSGNALAHYEPLREVINLTKMKGAGSLAHEWAHALDNIVSKSIGKKGYLTYGDSGVKSMDELLKKMKFREATKEEFEEFKNGRIATAEKNLVHFLERNCVPSNCLKGEEIEIKDELIDKIVSYAKENQLDYSFITNGSKGLEVIDTLNDFWKGATGRTIPADNRKAIFWYMDTLGSNCRLEGPQTVNTEFFKNSKTFDEQFSKSGHDYWSSEVEMFARAFACYIKDKLHEMGIRNDYLCGHAELGTSMDLKTDEVIRAYPTGEERKVLNKCFDNLFVEMKEKGLLHPEENMQLNRNHSL